MRGFPRQDTPEREKAKIKFKQGRTRVSALHGFLWFDLEYLASGYTRSSG